MVEYAVAVVDGKTPRQEHADANLARSGRELVSIQYLEA
jgi:hypothetical protein